MEPIINGPSSNAWGATICDPVLVNHQGKLIAFAREKNASLNVLYFQVFETRVAGQGTDSNAWNGWYRYVFPEYASQQYAKNENLVNSYAPAELRLSGMDLLTVSPAAQAATPADAAFDIYSDGAYFYLFRASTSGSLYLNRLILRESSAKTGGKQVTRYAIEPAWEVRFRRSGLRDVPLDRMDNQSFMDPVGLPFVEPTLEFSQITGARDGLFAVAQTPTATLSVNVIYIAAISDGKTHLYQIRQSTETVTDFSISETPLNPIAPAISGSGTTLSPIANIAPALVVYSEQEAAVSEGTKKETELPRQGRLMLAIPVTGSGLSAAVAIFDFALDKDGNIAGVPDTDQAITLVDGTIEGVNFQPDNSSPAFPTPGNIGDTARIIDGLPVNSMLLGQVRPHGPMRLHYGDDGLVHLYFGGPFPDSSSDLWSSLDPSHPQAMVAQFEPKASRLIIPAPWVSPYPGGQPGRSVDFVSRLPGPLMNGAAIEITDASFGATAQDDLCSVAVTYPEATGLPTETWTGVPRSLEWFMAVLNGKASDDSADPGVLSGTIPFFDFSGTFPVVRITLETSQSAPLGVFPPVLTMVSTRLDVPLSSISVTPANNTLSFVFSFIGPGSTTVTVAWTQVPPNIDAYTDIFAGTADESTYPYPVNSDNTVLFALATNAPQVNAPLLLISNGTNPGVANITIEVAAVAGPSNNVDVTFLQCGELLLQIQDVPSEVPSFISKIEQDAGFAALGLMFSYEGTGGNVMPSSSGTANGPLTLRETAVLFDLVLPPCPEMQVGPVDGIYPAGRQQHSFSTTTDLPDYQLAGFTAHSLRPENDTPAYVQNKDATGEVKVKTTRSHMINPAGTELSSGYWIRRTPPDECSFSGNNAMVVPVADGDSVLPQSANLRPQWDWTLETWFCPDAASQQRVITFLDNTTNVPVGAPALDYKIDVISQKVVNFQSCAPGKSSSFFQTGTSQKAEFLPVEEFTWELWIQPREQTALSGCSGGILQFLITGQNPPISLSMDSNRYLQLLTYDNNNTLSTYKSGESVDYINLDEKPLWTHMAIAGTRDNDSGLWGIDFIVNGRVTDSFSEVTLQDRSGACLIIGTNEYEQVSMFGQMAALRIWDIARSPADIRRTFFVSMTGNEAGLLGNWPMNALETDSFNNMLYLQNTADDTGKDWDAFQYINGQPVDMQDDSYFLSTIATVGGLPAVEANTMLGNGRWNHLAVVFKAGGAIRMNPGNRYNMDNFDWLSCGTAGSIGSTNQFAVDTWVLIPEIRPPGAGTILARWASDNDDQQCFLLWIDGDGELNLWVRIITSYEGDTEIFKDNSIGANLGDNQPHHIAVTFFSKPASYDGHTHEKISDASCTTTFYVDGIKQGDKYPDGNEYSNVDSIQVVTGQNPVLIGRAFLPAPSAAPIPADNFNFFRGTLGRLQYWNAAAGVEQLFPENYPRLPYRGLPAGLIAQWNFREQEGNTAYDRFGGCDGELSNSAMWTSFCSTSKMKFYANGANVGTTTPCDALSESTSSQFCLGAPDETTAGLIGCISQVSLWNRARSLEEIQDQQYIAIEGSEKDLIACWNFANGGNDITGGCNNASPAVDQSRIQESGAPLSNEGPYIQNVYGGVTNSLSQSVPGPIAVGAYADARDIGTIDQRGILKRQYLLDPNQTLLRPIQIGELDMIYVGQVQTKPTLIGVIEGAPPVPGENLTRPYYIQPSGAPYMKYLDTSIVTLNQQGSKVLGFQSSRAHNNKFNFSAALGLFASKEISALNVVLLDNKYVFKNTLQLQGTVFGEFKDEEGESFDGSWLGIQQDSIGLSGDWESFESDPQNYLNPSTGRRFIADNLGYALVESLTADLYALVFRTTNTSMGTMVLPNPNIPPDRNIILFPMDNTFVKATTLDGKVGLVNDPDYPMADIQRGSFFKPVEAYALDAGIKAREQRALSYAEQFNPKKRAVGSNTNLDDATAVIPACFEEEPGGPVSVAMPTQGLVNRFVWTADGGLHTESQAVSASTTRSYSGFRSVGGGGGFHGEGEFAFYVGFSWSLDFMYTHQVDLQVGKEIGNEQGVSLDVKVEGEACLKAYDPNAAGEYGSKGAFLPGPAPGKVKAYRFMSIYLPPRTNNSLNFNNMVDPVWKALSNSPMARALREINLSNPTWRILHRVTYIERVPPKTASRPFTSPVDDLRAPANLEGNITLLGLINDQIPAGTTNYTKLMIGDAVAAVMNPAPDNNGEYPNSSLEEIVSWWRPFLDLARSCKDNENEEAAAILLFNLTMHTTDYAFSAFAAGAAQKLLENR